MDEEEVSKECICPICYGDGIVTVMESAIGEDGPLAPLGERICDCQLIDDALEED